MSGLGGILGPAMRQAAGGKGGKTPVGGKGTGGKGGKGSGGWLPMPTMPEPEPFVHEDKEYEKAVRDARRSRRAPGGASHFMLLPGEGGYESWKRSRDPYGVGMGQGIAEITKGAYEEERPRTRAPGGFHADPAKPMRPRPGGRGGGGKLGGGDWWDTEDYRENWWDPEKYDQLPIRTYRPVSGGGGGRSPTRTRATGGFHADPRKPMPRRGGAL